MSCPQHSHRNRNVERVILCVFSDFVTACVVIQYLICVSIHYLSIISEHIFYTYVVCQCTRSFYVQETFGTRITSYLNIFTLNCLSIKYIFLGEGGVPSLLLHKIIQQVSILLIYDIFSFSVNPYIFNYILIRPCSNTVQH